MWTLLLLYEEPQRCFFKTEWMNAWKSSRRKKQEILRVTWHSNNCQLERVKVLPFFECLRKVFIRSFLSNKDVRFMFHCNGIVLFIKHLLFFPSLSSDVLHLLFCLLFHRNDLRIEETSWASFHSKRSQVFSSGGSRYVTSHAIVYYLI